MAAKVIKGPIKFIYGLFSIRESDQEQHDRSAINLQNELSIIDEPVTENLSEPVNIAAITERELNRAQQHANRIIESAQKRASDIEQKTRAKSDKLLSTAQLKADDERKKANQDAQKIKKEAHQKAKEEGKADGLKIGNEEGLKKGRSEGYQQGYKDGISKGHKEYEDAIDYVKKLADEILTEREAVRKKTESDLIGLVVEITEKIIGEMISRREMIYNVAKKALEYAIGSENILVKVNPEDFATLGKHREELLAIVGQSTSFEIVEDESVDNGGCILETNMGRIDAQISSQMDTIKETLGVKDGDTSS